MAKARIVVEFDIETEENTTVKESDILNAVFIDDDYVVDGFCVTTDVENHNNTEDFFLFNGKIIKRELIKNGK